ncbi:MAG: EI24 domain-containing protein [Chitinophagales bacterium]
MMGNYLKEIQKAFSAYKKAHHFIIQHRLYYWMLLPVVLNILIFFAFVSIGWGYADMATAWIFESINAKEWDWGNFNFIIDIFRFFLEILFRLIIVLVYLSFFKYLILVFLAPLLAYLSEKTEELYTGKTYPFEIKIFLYNAFRGVLVALRNLFLELLFTLLFALSSFIPVVGILSPGFTFMAESYFFGYSMIDYYCERKKMSIAEGTRFINKHFTFTLGNGAVFNTVFILPSFVAIFPLLLFSLIFKYLFLLPVLVLSALPVYSIVAATIGIIDLEKKDKDAR